MHEQRSKLLILYNNDDKNDDEKDVEWRLKYNLQVKSSFAYVFHFN